MSLLLHMYVGASDSVGQVSDKKKKKLENNNNKKSLSQPTLTSDGQSVDSESSQDEYSDSDESDYGQMYDKKVRSASYYMYIQYITFVNVLNVTFCHLSTLVHRLNTCAIRITFIQHSEIGP